MEDLLTTAFQSGNATAIISGVIVYIIVFLQRKNTAATRDDTISKLNDEITVLKNQKILLAKDIEYLMCTWHGPCLKSGLMRAGTI